jgi:hypothetical protein
MLLTRSACDSNLINTLILADDPVDLTEPDYVGCYFISFRTILLLRALSYAVSFACIVTVSPSGNLSFLL